jgi:hypothetical protein
MPFAVPSIDRAHSLDHQDTSLDIGDRSMLHALGHLEHVAHVQFHRVIDAELLGVLGRGRFG